MDIFIEFAKKFFELAKKDFEKARKAFEEKDYPECVFHSQQCVEKCVESLIEIKKEYVYNHGFTILSIFLKLYDEKEINVKLILEALSFLTEFYTKSRYPFLHLGKVLSPEDIINKEIAKKALEYAEKVLKETEEYLKKNGVI